MAPDADDDQRACGSRSRLERSLSEVAGGSCAASPRPQGGVRIAMDLRVATNSPPASAEQHIYSLGDHLRVRRRCYWHHAIYVGADRVVQFGGVLFDKPHSGIEEVALHEFHRGDRVEVVPKQQKWLGLWDLPPALPPEEIVRRARWLADRRFEGTYNLIGRNCETAALWCVCNMGESLQRQRFRAANAYLGGVVYLIYAYLNGRGRAPSWATRTILAFMAVRVALLVMYYRHNVRFYRDVRPYYTERAGLG